MSRLSSGNLKEEKNAHSTWVVQAGGLLHQPRKLLLRHVKEQNRYRRVGSGRVLFAGKQARAAVFTDSRACWGKTDETHESPFSAVWTRNRDGLWPWAGIRWKPGDQMLYKKINLELIVVADEAEAVIAELNVALDRLEEKHTLFGGEIETVAIEHPGTRKRSALAHTMAAGETVASALRTARNSVNIALRAVI
jgi:hypothetical protein